MRKRLQTITIFILILAGFGLRLRYATTTHPFFDEYTTVLAARQILQHGWPVLPSGLFYEHGLLATYLITPFTALFINTPPAQWQPAQWGLMLSRWPSVMLGTATIPLIFILGQHAFSLDRPGPGESPAKTSALLAAGLFALSPEGMVWGGRARMYAPATLLVLLTLYWAYRGARYPAPARYRWAALLILLAAVLTQFGVMMLIPPLVVGMLVVGWRSRPREAGERNRGEGVQGRGGAEEQGGKGARGQGGKGARGQGGKGARGQGGKGAREAEEQGRGGAREGRSKGGEKQGRGGAREQGRNVAGAEQRRTIGQRDLGQPQPILGRVQGSEIRNPKSEIRNQASAIRNPQSKIALWFLRPAILLEGAALAGVIGLAILVKRLGRPLGAAALGRPGSGKLLAELVNTVTYQTTFYFTWPDTLDFLARQFGVPHHFWLTLVTLTGAVVGVAVWLTSRIRSRGRAGRHLTNKQNAERRPDARPFFSGFNLYLWLIFGLMILLMVTLLEPFRRNPRYIVMYLPLFYLIAARSIYYQLAKLFSLLSSLLSPLFSPSSLSSATLSSAPLSSVSALALLLLFTLIGLDDLRIALLTPEPAYEEAFAHIRAEWQPGDALLAMNTPAAGLYLGQVDGFTVQNEADQFLLEAGSNPVDRWLGAPWIGQAADFNAVLNAHERTWFVIDAIRQPVYFRGDWLAVINGQMEPVWAKDNALIYRTRPNRTPLPTRPDVLTGAVLGQAIKLTGYALHRSDSQPAPQKVQDIHFSAANSEIKLTLFWHSLASVPADYTTFLHLRNGQGTVVAQHDGQPLDGAYPTSYWQPGETIIDPVTLPLPESLPAGSYTLVTGLYQLDTLERLPVANDSSGENSILLGEITLP